MLDAEALRTDGLIVAAVTAPAAHLDEAIVMPIVIGVLEALKTNSTVNKAKFLNQNWSLYQVSSKQQSLRID